MTLRRIHLCMSFSNWITVVTECFLSSKETTNKVCVRSKVVQQQQKQSYGIGRVCRTYIKTAAFSGCPSHFSRSQPAISSLASLVHVAAAVDFACPAPFLPLARTEVTCCSGVSSSPPFVSLPSSIDCLVGIKRALRLPFRFKPGSRHSSSDGQGYAQEANREHEVPGHHGTMAALQIHRSVS